MKKSNKTIEEALEYIEEHLSDEIKLEHISDVAGYSKFHFNKLFAEHTGQTIHKYIQNRRLTLAAQNLVDTEKSILTIAFEAGYGSQQSFTLAFKQMYNITPQVYRLKGRFSITNRRLAA